MSKSIKLSPKYNLNPCIPICFFCGKEKNEIAVLGRIGDKKEDIQAPHNALLDYTPCDTCQEMMSKGITMIGVVSHKINNLPEIAPNAYPTGSWCVTSEDFVQHIITDENVLQDILKHKRCIIDDNILQDLIKQSETQKEN